jgi:hypothetical protein
MEPSNLSINSTQQSASQFFQKSVASLQSWGSRVCQQLHHHREILHTYSPKTKIGLLIIVNALFFVITRAIVNYWEARANQKYPEKTLLNDKIATALVGVVTAGVNVGLSKLGRYQLPALTLYALTISSMVVYQILKRPQPLLAPLLTEIRDELREIDQAQTIIRERLAVLGVVNDSTSIPLSSSTPPRSSTLSTPSTPPRSSTLSPPSTPPRSSTLSPPSTPTSSPTPSTPVDTGTDTTQTEEIQALTQTQQNLSNLEVTLRRDAQVLETVERNFTSSPNPGTPGRVNLLRTSMQNRFNEAMAQSRSSSSSDSYFPQRSSSNTLVLSRSSTGIPRTPESLRTPPSSPISPDQARSNLNTGITPATPPSSTILSSSSTQDGTDPTGSIPNSSESMPDPQEVLRTPQSTTSWLVTGAIQHVGPFVLQNAPNIANSILGFIRR